MAVEIQQRENLLTVEKHDDIVKPANIFRK